MQTVSTKLLALSPVLSARTLATMLQVLGGPKFPSQPALSNLSRNFASSTETAHVDGQNSWSKFRSPYGFEQKSSLLPAMYATIAVFGFSMYLNDMIYHPPRVVTLLGLMTLLLYVRRR